MNPRTRKIVIAGSMGAISVILGATRLGFIPWFAGVSLTIMHLPVIIGAVLEGPVVGLIIGFIFGLFSLIQAAIAPTGPADVWFVNPLVSIFPRLWIGVVAWFVYKPLSRLSRHFAAAAAGVSGSLTNTILVLSILGLLKKLPWNTILVIAGVNGLPESGVAAVIVTAVISVFFGIEKKKKGPKI